MSRPIAAAVLASPPDLGGWPAMSHASPAAPEVDLDQRQLRHLSKNALQRLLCEVAKTADEQTDWGQRRLLADLERRLMLSARVSDALFGFTRYPAPFPQRLTELAEATVELLGDADQSIEVAVTVTGLIEAKVAASLLRIAHEMIGNAVRHGLRERAIGRIEIAVVDDALGTRLLVCDDGWGPAAPASEGGGLAMMHDLAAPMFGEVSLTREGGRTRAALAIPRLPGGGMRWLGLMVG